MTRKEFIDFLKENGLERLGTRDALWTYKGYPLNNIAEVTVGHVSVDMFTNARIDSDKIVMFGYATFLPFDTAKMMIETVINKLKKLKKEIRLNKIEAL